MPCAFSTLLFVEDGTGDGKPGAALAVMLAAKASVAPRKERKIPNGSYCLLDRLETSNRRTCNAFNLRLFRAKEKLMDDNPFADDIDGKIARAPSLTRDWLLSSESQRCTLLRIMAGSVSRD